MDVRTWTTVSRLLDDALDLPASARPAWIETLGPEYEALKPQLRALLAQADGLDRASFLATLPKFDTSADDGLDDAPSRVGALVGPYRLLQPIASGGQGAVWRAERADGLLARPVAVKLPHGLGFRPGLAERMAREREILATLTHPNIARLYDAGVTADGEPFLALEYVEGTAIDQHVAARGLTVPERVRLFLQVVRAVAFAHGRLVIHRDLKPSNVLVTPEGDVRLLDFGIAKLLDEAADSTLTVEAGRAMTLAYASPEQIAQQPLGVATDVYSLGVLLFELLTGARPYALARESAAALEEAILTQEPRRASQAAPTAAARKVLAGDLDTILAKALRKAPHERYASADALGDDLGRWLDGLPVTARPDSRTYRMRRFVGRHRVGVAATAASLLAVLAGAGVAVWQAGVARSERDAALVQEARARASSGFLQSLLQQAGADKPVTATELLERGAARLETATDIEPAVLAYLQYEISTHFLRFNQTAREVALLTRSAASARRAGDRALEAAALCSAAWSLAMSDIGESRRHLDDAERAFAAVPAPSFALRADCLRARARVLDMQGQRAQAIALLEQTLPTLQLDRESDWARRSLVRNQLTDLYRQVDRIKDALRLNEEALAEARRRGQAGTLNEFSGMNNVAATLGRLGEQRAAYAMYLDMTRWLERGMFAVPPLAFQSNIGLVELRLGRAGEALRLADAERVADLKAGNALQAAIADMLAGRALLALGRLDEARTRLDAADAVFAKNPQGNARLMTQIELARTELLQAAGRPREAIVAADRLLAGMGYPADLQSTNLDRALRLSASLRLATGDHDAADTLATDALAVATRIARDPRQSADVGEAALIRARVRHAHGDLDGARTDAALAVDALSAALGADHALTVEAALLAAR